MQRCLALARKGFGHVAPNPMAGCVIVYKGKVIGEGFHRKYGSAHAEVNAINAVRDKSLIKHATLYVNLEPCSHFGKTPPCADLIVSSGIQYVVVGAIDPNPLVQGRGLKKLVSAGCDVKLGILENECRELNRRFYTFYEKKRPYVILKWAETSDRYIGVSGARYQVSGEKATQRVHQWRSQEQAIMVGTNTALEDNPRLTVRKLKGQNPLRIFIDRQLIVPQGHHLLDGKVPTVVFTQMKNSVKGNLEYVSLDFEKDVLKQVLAALFKRKIQSVIVEGGAKLLNSFIEQGLWDEARVLSAKKKSLGNHKGIRAPKISGATVSKKKIGSDELSVIHPLRKR